MTQKVLAARYTPRKEMQAFHSRTKRFALMVCHRRFGKTVAAIQELRLRALHKPARPSAPPRFAYVAPFRTQAKDNAWDYLKESVADIPGIKISESELSVTFPHNGARIKIYGADDPDSLRGGYFDGVVLDEYGDMKGEVWTAVVRPMLSDYRGWAVFIGTPKGHNAFYELRERARLNVAGTWYYQEVRASQSGVLSQEELDDARESMDEDEFMAEYECSFEAAIRGSYYGRIIGKLQESNVLPVPVYQGIPVHTWWDLGYADATAVGFVQLIRGEIHFVDYYEGSNKSIHEIMDDLADMRDEEGNAYEIETLYLPHDARAHTVHTGQSLIEQLASYGIEIQIVERQKVRDGIEAVRKMLPQMFFDEQRCYPLVEHLKAYQRKYDPNRGVFSDTPLHDKSSHAADMVRQVALTVQDDMLKKTKAKPKKAPTHREAQEAWHRSNHINIVKPLGITLDQLFASNKRSGSSSPPRI